MSTQPTGLFRETISALKGCWPLKFLHTLQPLKCILSWTWVAGWKHVGLCPIFLVSPPGTLVPKTFCFSRDVFFNQTQDLRAPSADRHETLPRDHYLLEINNPDPKIRGPSPKKFDGQKTCKI